MEKNLPENFDALIEQLLNHPEVTERRLAATELGKTRDSRAIEPLLKALSDHEDVAIFATLALVGIGQDAIPELREGLKSQEEQIRGYCAEILGELQAVSALEDLIELIEKDESVWVKNSAVEAIGRIKEPRSTEILKKLLKENENWIVVSAALALHRLGTKDINLADVLVGRISAENEFERGITSWALVEICDKSSIPYLQGITGQRNDEVMKKTINDIIKGISMK
ncbi:MAG: hypothetical protein A2Y33_09455 [Spirochaetes bacterium GWF1_51_8]|nr:MAG: hypothetical protein A2Y33_09455 [Spirochaetes bacterium GWF1_51_8]